LFFINNDKGGVHSDPSVCYICLQNVMLISWLLLIAWLLSMTS